MISRERVLQMLAAGHSYESAAQALGVRPGLVYHVATGRPADGSDSVPSGPDGTSRPPAPSQQLANPQPADNPTDRDDIKAWVRHRAARDTAMQRAKDAASQEDD